jgi:Tol biopolymer transport system component
VPATRLSLVGLAAAAALLAVPAVRHLREQPPPPPPTLALTLPPPAGAELGSGDEALDAALAPGGGAIALVATADGVTSLWHRVLDADRARLVPGTGGARLPAWHPDGDRIAFFAGGRLHLASLSDGSTRVLAEAPEPAGATWLPDGTLIFAPRANGPLARLADGAPTAATALAPGERAHVFPMAVGSTGHLVYTAVADDGRRTVHLVREDGSHVTLGPTSAHGQIAGDHWLWVRGDVLYAQAIDADLVPYGPIRTVATDVGVTADGRGSFVASPRLLLAAPVVARPRLLTWFDPAGTRTGTIGEPGDLWQVRLSPDDRHVAVTMLAPLLRTLDVAVIPTAGGGQARLSLAVAADRHPVWAPDGGAVLYQSLRGGAPGLLTRPTHDVEAMPEPFLDGRLTDTPTDWRGGRVLVHGADPASGQDIWSLDADTGARDPIVRPGFNDTDGRWSPDTRWIAYVSDESGRPDVYVARLADGLRVRVSSAGGTRPRWSRDGRSIYFLRGSWIVRADRDGADGFATPVPLFDAGDVRDFDVAHRRDAVLALVPTGVSAGPPVSVLVDWRSALP